MVMIQTIADYRRAMARLSPEIDLTISGRDRIPDRVQALWKIQQMIDRLLTGELSPDEYVQAIEPMIGLWGTVDQYIAECSDLLGIR